MSWKERVNAVLDRALGLRLVRTGTVKKALAAQAAPVAPAPGPRRLPKDYEAEFQEIWPLVRERTMTGHAKVFALYHATLYIERYKIPGAIVECGVWRGGSMLTVANTLDRHSSYHRELYLFDTFEGMSAPTARDVHVVDGCTATDLLEQSARTAQVWAIATLEDVRQGFREVSYPAERVHFVKGKVEDTVPDAAPEQIAILRLDTDWYESTRHELIHLYDRLVPGGILIIDDYGSWEGSRDATEEFLDVTGEPLMLIRAGRGRIGVKPGLPSHVPNS